MHLQTACTYAQATLSGALCHVPAVVALLQADPTAQELTDAGMLPAAFQAMGAFSVLGGNLPSLFVGCRVSVEAEVMQYVMHHVMQHIMQYVMHCVMHHAMHYVMQAAHGQTSREQGTLVRWDGAEDSDAVRSSTE